MKNKTTYPYPLPTTGAILAFFARCLSVATEKAHGYKAKEFERLSKGGLSRKNKPGQISKLEQVSRRVIDEIVSVFTGTVGASVTDAVLIEKDQNPSKYLGWEHAPDGQLLNLRDHLVRDLIEFVQRHEFLLERFGSGKCEPPIMFQWLGRFVLPFLVVNLVEYQRNGADIENGMPCGKFWYLPEILLPSGPEQKPRIKWPTHSVLEWWQDLLGCPLQSLAHKLCLPGLRSDDERIDNAERQVRSWMTEDRPPKLGTIEQWCRQDWEYKGAFTLEPSLPLTEQWNRCKAFLIAKGFHRNDNWLDSVPLDMRKLFGQQYRGERLELEILPFKETPFAAFFTESDAIGAGLPVAELIRRVAERFKAPSNIQLKARLLIAAAFQRAFARVLEAMGPDASFKLLGWFRELHCTFMDLHNRANPETREGILELLRAEYCWGDDLRDSTDWLFEQESWEKFAAELAAVFLEAKQRTR